MEPIDQGPVYSTEQMFSKAVRCFQRKFGLQETGKKSRSGPTASAFIKHTA